MDKLPSLIPPGPPVFRAPANSLAAEATPQQVNRQLRELFREAFDDLGGARWLVEFASKSDSNARVFVQAISKLLPPANDVKQQGGVIIDVPWLTSTRLAYKREGATEIIDVQVKMADRLSDPDHVEWLRQLSDVLRSGASKVKKYEPPALPLISGTLDSLGKGTEAWAYGDKLLGPGVNKPLVTEKTLDMLGALPTNTAGAAASKAMFVPAILRDAKHAQKVQDLIDSGADSSKLWKEAGLSKVPKKPSDNPFQERFAEEIDDSAVRFGPRIPLMSAADKEEYIANTFSPLQREGARQRASKIAIPRPGTYEQGDLLNHPELYDMFPELKQGLVHIKNQPTLASRGKYMPKDDEIQMNIPRFLDAPGHGGGMVGTNLHELTHRLANKYDFPQGSSPKSWEADPQVWGQLDNLMQDSYFRKALGKEGSEHATRMLRYKDKPAYQAYINSPGEKYALAAQRRYMLSPEERVQYDPHESVLKGIYDEPDSQFAYHMLEALKESGKKHLDPTVNVPQLLRRWGTIGSMSDEPESFADLLNPKPWSGFDFKVNPGKSVEVHDTTRRMPVASMGVDPDETHGKGLNSVSDLFVEPGYRKMGLATEMYQRMLESGTPLAKSTDLTPEGLAMWAAFHRKGLAKDNRFVGKK